MKTENQIRNLLEALEGINEKNFGDLDNFKNWKHPKYVSPINVDDDGEPVVIEGHEAGTILNSVQTAIDTLEWVLEEMSAVKPAENEIEVTHYGNQGKLGYDGDNTPMVPDTSHETFIDKLEGEW
jgi:hypothetical protein